MRRIWLYAVWLIVAVAVAAAAGFCAWGCYQARQLAQLRAQSDALARRIESLDAALAEKEAALKLLQAKVTNQQPKPPAGTPEAQSGMASLFGKMMAAAVGGDKDAKPDEGQQGNPFSAFAKMYSGEQGKEMTRYSAEMAVNMQYQELFTALHLPADVEQRVREVLKDSMAEQITSGMESLGGRASPEAMKGVKDDFDTKLRAKVAAILSPEEMTAWDEYQATLPKRMMAQSLDMQLNMYAPTLAPELRTRTRDVLVEELLPTQADQQGVAFPTGADLESHMAAQQEAYTRARERLAQELDETQLAQVDRVITQMQQITEMGARMMENMFPKEEKPK